MSLLKGNIYGKIAIPVIIGIVVAIFLFNKDFNPDALRSVRLTPLSIIGFSCALIAIALREGGMAWRFHVLTRKDLNWKKSFRITFLCEFTSAITPSSVGGSALSMIFLNREGIKIGRATTLTMTILFLDMLFFTIFCPLMIIISKSGELFDFASQSLNHSIRTLFWIAYGLVCAVTTLLLLGIFILPKAINNGIKKITNWQFLKKWKNDLLEIGENMFITSKNIKHLPWTWWAQGFAATAVSWVGRFLVVNALFFALVPGASQWTVFARQFIVWALLMFSPTPGGSGISEWLFDKYYGDLITTGGITMVLAILWRILTYYLYLAIGIFFIPWFFKNKRNDNLPECEN